MEMNFRVEIKSIVLRIGAVILTVLLFFIGSFLLVLNAYENFLQCILGTFFCFALCLFIILSSFFTSISYSEEFIEIRILWIKSRENFSVLSNIMHSHYIGGYWINTLDNRHYHIWMPGTKKMMLKMCEEIRQHNKDFISYIV